MNLPVAGPLGVAALLAGPLARLPIDLGAAAVAGHRGARSQKAVGPGTSGSLKRPDFRVYRRPAGMNSPADAVLPGTSQEVAYRPQVQSTKGDTERAR
jgi:hypothetical protein